MRYTWSSLGLEAPPSNAPPWYFIFGRTRLRLVGYDAYNWERQDLSDDWAVDIDHSTTPASATGLRAGDVVIYVGEAWRASGTVAWPPALVVGARSRGEEEQRVVTLTSRHLQAWQVDDLDDLLQHHIQSEHHVLEGPIARKFLSRWGLDAACPMCGWLGSRVSTGLAPAPRVSGPDGPMDPGLAVVDRGCVSNPDVERWRCARCAHSWPQRDPEIWSFDDFALEPHGVTTSQDLQRLIRENVESELVTVPREFEDAEIVAFDVAGERFRLDYPFLMSEFWALVSAACIKHCIPTMVLPPVYPA